MTELLKGAWSLFRAAISSAGTSLCTALLFDSRKRPGEAEQVSAWPMGISSAMRMVRIAGIHFSCCCPGVGVAEPPIFLAALIPVEKLSLK